jgi:hypothetical protein
MSPRAAWQLEEMGFSDVSDFVDGKLEWISHGLPLEGTGPHFAVAGEVADRDAVFRTTRNGSTAGPATGLSSGSCFGVIAARYTRRSLNRSMDSHERS